MDQGSLFNLGLALGGALSRGRDDKREGREKKKAEKEESRNDNSALAALLPQVLGNPETTPAMLQHLAQPNISARVQGLVPVAPQFIGLGGSLVPPVTAQVFMDSVEDPSKAPAELLAMPQFQTAVRNRAAKEQAKEVGLAQTKITALDQWGSRNKFTPEMQRDYIAAWAIAHPGDTKGVERASIYSIAPRHRPDTGQGIMFGVRQAQRAKNAFATAIELNIRTPEALSALAREGGKQAVEQYRLLLPSIDDPATQARRTRMAAATRTIWDVGRQQPFEGAPLQQHVEDMQAASYSPKEMRDDLSAAAQTGRPLQDAMLSSIGAPTSLQIGTVQRAKRTEDRLHNDVVSRLAANAFDNYTHFENEWTELLTTEKYKDAQWESRVAVMAKRMEVAWNTYIGFRAEIDMPVEGATPTSATQHSRMTAPTGLRNTAPARRIGGGRGGGKAAGGEGEGRSVNGMLGFLRPPFKPAAIMGLSGSFGGKSVRARNLDTGAIMPTLSPGMVYWQSSDAHNAIKEAESIASSGRKIRAARGASSGGGGSTFGGAAAPASPTQQELDAFGAQWGIE